MTSRFVAAALGAFVFVAAPRAQAPAPERPKLVVLLMVDQMRSDYLDRYGANLDGGFKRLLSGAAYYTNAALPYMNTVTCAGHTGARPKVTYWLMGETQDRPARRARSNRGTKRRMVTRPKNDSLSDRLAGV